MTQRMNRLFIVFTSIVILILSLVSVESFPSSVRSKEVIARISPILSKRLHEKNLKLGSPIFIRIFKESKELEVWMETSPGKHFQLVASYKVHYFSGNLGPKLKEGDKQAPEGFYYVPPSRMNPRSRFHLSFNLGYPNLYDRTHGRTGSALMVHGSTVSIGCFAMTDPIIEEIYTYMESAMRNGQKFVRVHCFPFRMTPERMEKHKQSPWLDFWNNLKIGYDHFEKNKRPPNVEVRQSKYTFQAI